MLVEMEVEPVIVEEISPSKVAQVFLLLFVM